jgi:dihydrofolate reductase/thymidylate synthase
MFDMIVAHNLSYGIGCKGIIPWFCKEDLKLFKKLTTDSVLIMGRKTIETLPPLPGRVILCISRRPSNSYPIFSSLKDALNFASAVMPSKKVFIAGGKEIYKLALDTCFEHLDTIHVSVIKNHTPCDVFVHEIYNYLKSFTLQNTTNYNEFTYYLFKKDGDEQAYLNLLTDVVKEGTVRFCRNGETKSLFGRELKFDLRSGFPLLTTKKMFLRGIIEELLFFIRGDTDTKKLEDVGVNIWRKNTERKFLDSLGMCDRKEGEMGPMYGYQWRFFGAKYDEKTGRPEQCDSSQDQLKYVIDTIKTDPTSRRIMMTDYNPNQAFEGVLFPCHSIVVQFYVDKNFLDMYCYNRSQDLFLGTPFNIASSALLLTLIAKISDLTPRHLHMGLGDVHIYKEHYEAVAIQIARIPYSFPKIEVKKSLRTLEDLEKLQAEDIELKNYSSHSAIKADMVA